MSGLLRRVVDYDRDRPRPGKVRGLIRRRRFRFLGKGLSSGSAEALRVVGKVPPPGGTTTLRKLRQMQHVERSFGSDPVSRVAPLVRPPAVEKALRKLRQMRRWDNWTAPR